MCASGAVNTLCFVVEILMYKISLAHHSCLVYK